MYRETCWYQSKKLIVQAWLSTHINGSNEYERCQERGITNVIFHSILFFSPWMVSGVRGEVAESPHSLLVLQTVHFQPLPPFSTGAYGIISSFPSCLFPSLSSFFLFLHFYCYPLSPFLLLSYLTRFSLSLSLLLLAFSTYWSKHQKSIFPYKFWVKLQKVEKGRKSRDKDKENIVM